MSGWTVRVELGGDTGDVTDDAIEAFLEALIEYGGAVSGGAGFLDYGATISVDAGDAVQAASRGIVLVTTAAATARLPDWPVIDIQATTDAEIDRQLAGPADRKTPRARR